MKRSIYGKKMFIADLIIVSLWALFTWHFTGELIMTTVMIGLRLALCFMLYRKSRWTFFNAVLFATMYVGLIFNMPCDDIAFEPIVKVAYIGCCLLGYSDWAIHAFDYHYGLSAEIPVYILWGLYSLWLTFIPLVCSWKFKTVLPLFRHHKMMIWFVGAVVAISLYVWTTKQDYSIFIGGFLMSLAPMMYRCIYRKGKQPLLQSILHDRILIIYVSIATVMFSSILIGLYEVNAAKPFASFLFPIVLYITALKACHIKVIKTIPALLLGVAGILAVLVYNRGHEMVIILLCVSGLLSSIGVYLVYRECRSVFTAVLLLCAYIFVLPVSLLGYNPYAAVDVNEVVSIKSLYPSFHRGLYEFKKDGSIGLRDRYGIVLYANYQEVEFLDGESDYMVLYGYSRDLDDYVIDGIYDLKHRRNLLPENADDLYRIEEIRNKIYAIYDHEDNRRFTLSLPKFIYDDYKSEIQLIDWSSEEPDEVQLPSDLSYMTVTESDDGKLTLYAYDTGCGGTSPEYSTYIRYEYGDSVVTDYLYPLTESDYVCASDIRKDGSDIYDGSFSTILSQIPLSETETGYIIEAYNKASSVEGSKEAYLVKYVDGKLKKMPFEKKSGEICKSVGRDYYIPDWYFTTDGLGWDWVLSYDKETSTLYMPEDDGIMVMSDRYDLYQFKNGKMRYVGNEAGYWLHPSLRDFNFLSGIYQTDTNLIRVDEMSDFTYRYSSWLKSNPMSSEPDLILYDGKAGIVENAIVFKNGNYTYIVPAHRKGQGNDFGRVIIKYKDKVLLETEV